ncbi:MAG: translocation/assembly module TamB domain-containing protein [Bdellovibrionaceae bacterium]|nr:translocation/assembly module TamB domain-containing protein [Pseudobdellovibrionaceae bacterium]
MFFSILIIVFLFTPISLYKIDQRIENILNSKAIAGVKKFEKQTGLKIEWGTLDFNIFLMTVKLEDVQINYFKESQLNEVKELSLLDGLQKIKKISARPSIYSFLFKKEIILSKLNIELGELSLKTIKNFNTKKNQSKNVKLPIKKILIKNTNVSLNHKNYSIKFLDIKAKISQKKWHDFNFDLNVQSFYLNKNSGIEDFSNLKARKVNEDQVYQLLTKGILRKNQISFSEINLKNNLFDSFTKSLQINFDSEKIDSIKLISSGSIPIHLIKEALSLIDQDLKLSGSNLFYDVNIQYKKRTKYGGSFSLSSKDMIFQSEEIKNIELKGSFSNRFLTINKGSLYTVDKGSFYIKKIKWGFLEKSLPFYISANMNELSSDFINRSLLYDFSFPIKADLTGAISCEGAFSIQYIKCDMKAESPHIKLQIKQNPILSFYNMNLDSILVWENQKIDFEVNGSNKTANFNFKGKYFEDSEDFSSDYSFLGNLGSDLQFNSTFPIEGAVSLSKGKVFIKNNRVELSGLLNSDNLKIDSYQLENISSPYKFKNNKLSFVNIKGRPGETNYSGNIEIDFNKEDIKLKLDSDFFSLQDFLRSVKNKLTSPVVIKGSGSVSVFLYFSWKNKYKKEFQIKGDFFNALIAQDFFTQSTFDITFKNKKGIVKSLLFKKGQGLIEGSGTFDEKYKLDLTMNGKKLSLESIEFLNKALPLNQSGDINFNLDIKGTLKKPLITGSAVLSNTFLYSYPIKNSEINLKITKDFFSFSGNIMDEIRIDQFSYPFSKNSNFKIKGIFYNFDLIKVLLAKNKKKQIQEYSSQLKGSFDLNRIKTSFWKSLIKIDELLITKSKNWIKNKDPISIRLYKDKWSLTSSVNFLDNKNDILSIKRIDDTQLSLNGSVSLGLFSVMTPFFEEFEGDIKGQILLSNNLKNLNPKGFLQIEKGLIKIQPLPNFINVSTKLVFSNNNLIINNFNSVVGGGIAKGMGSLFYDFTKAPRLNLNLNFNNVHFQIPEGFNTKGNGNIQIKGFSPPYLISGNYNIDSGSIVRDFSAGTGNKKYNFSFLEKKENKKRSLFKLNLDIKTKQAVSINSSLIRSSIEGQANIYGPFNDLLVNGDFLLSEDLKQNSIFFRGQEFEINTGSISFNNTPPTNPYLDISANTVIKEEFIDPSETQEKIKKEYKIFLSTKGFSEELNFSLKSNPVLNEKEIISLLTLGVNSQWFDANVKQNITDYSYYPYQIVTSLLIEKSLNKEIKDTLGLDFRLTPYIDALNKPVTKITLSKNWFEKWRTSFSRSIEESAHSDARLKYNLNDKVSLTAFWENKEQMDIQETEKDFLGLDVEFSFDF